MLRQQLREPFKNYDVFPLRGEGGTLKYFEVVFEGLLNW